ncbi:acyl-CoA carboxylase subunit beta, partial [Chloroflexota bacterium]
LLDPGSFTELGMLVSHGTGAPSDGIVTGYGTIDGRVVCVFAQDATVAGGSIGPTHGLKMYRTVERALDMRVPFIGLYDSPGARTARPGEKGGAMGVIREKSGSAIFYPHTEASGIIPQISAILGSCAGIGVYSPALTDFVFMVDKTSHMFLTGPRIVKSVMGEDTTMEELGGARIHSQITGLADYRMKSEEECLQTIRKLIGFLPSNSGECAVVESTKPNLTMDKSIEDLVPMNPYKVYDMHEAIKHIVDDGDFLEVKAEFAAEIIIGFGRLGAQTIGIVANQPMAKAGSMTAESSSKQARFIRFCDCFNIPIIMLIDTPAYMPGSAQEKAGIIRHGAKVLYALCEATVPRIAVVLRKAYGGGTLGMGVLQGLQTDLLFLWPSAELGVLGAEQSVELYYADEISKSEKPEETRQKKIEEYRENYANPFAEISENPYADDIIAPTETRERLFSSLQLLKNKRLQRQPKRHGNIPL